MEKLVQTTYSPDDVIMLMQDIEGKVPILDTEEREFLNQQGIHYSEMLPKEYVPTQEYMSIYQQSLNSLSLDTAYSVAEVSKKIYKKHGNKVVLISLARAGTPVGILIKHYLEFKFKIEVPHYSISIIRDKGIDIKAMNTIIKKYNSEDIQFIDGWVGKGVINNILNEACEDLKRKNLKFKDLDSTLAVLSDPAYVTDTYGTRNDFLIPSACLNATVTGLLSRTVKLKNMTDDEYHGAVFYRDNVKYDQSYNFISSVEQYFENIDNYSFQEVTKSYSLKGINEVYNIAKEFNIKDINKIKPGVGETTRVLLRRVPDFILINKNADKKYLEHIFQLSKEKQVPIKEYPLKNYNACGIIKELV